MQYEKFTHEYWLSEAIKEAGTVNNEIPVCAILVKDNNIISKAVNRTEELKDSTAHAEILAIREASRIFSDWRLNGCTLYSTLEPCSMCMGAILNSRVSKLVFGAYDLDAGACGSAFTDATGVESGQFLIQSVTDKFTTGKIALVVAGYNVDDTVAGATYLTHQVVNTDAGTKYKGTSSTSATLVVE